MSYYFFPFAYCSVYGEFTHLIDVLALFQLFCNHEIFIKLNLVIILLLVRKREKSQKYFDLSTFDWNLNDSNLFSTHGAMNF